MRRSPAKVQIGLLTTVLVLLIAAVSSFNKQTSAQPTVPVQDGAMPPPADQAPPPAVAAPTPDNQTPMPVVQTPTSPADYPPDFAVDGAGAPVDSNYPPDGSRDIQKDSSHRKQSAKDAYLIVVKPLSKGSVITKDSIEVHYCPSHKVTAELRSKGMVTGRQATRDLKVGVALRPSDIESPTIQRKTNKD